MLNIVMTVKIRPPVTPVALTKISATEDVESGARARLVRSLMLAGVAVKIPMRDNQPIGNVTKMVVMIAMGPALEGFVVSSVHVRTVLIFIGSL